MKNLLIMGTLLLSMNSFAGNEKGNGGDVCENQMRNVSNDIESWLINENFKGIKLPLKISEDMYKESMLNAVKKSLLSCTSEKLQVGGAEKTCKNFQDKNGDTRIVCNFDRFLKTEEKEKYKLMHHELAGVAGLESNNGQEASKYLISNQLTDYLREETVLKLSIKDQSRITDRLLLKDLSMISRSISSLMIDKYTTSSNSVKFSLRAIVEKINILALNAEYDNYNGKTEDKILISCSSGVTGYSGMIHKVKSLNTRLIMDPNNSEEIKRSIDQITHQVEQKETVYLNCVLDLI